MLQSPDIRFQIDKQMFPATQNMNHFQNHGQLSMWHKNNLKQIKADNIFFNSGTRNDSLFKEYHFKTSIPVFHEGHSLRAPWPLSTQLGIIVSILYNTALTSHLLNDQLRHINEMKPIKNSIWKSWIDFLSGIHFHKKMLPYWKYLLYCHVKKTAHSWKKSGQGLFLHCCKRLACHQGNHVVIWNNAAPFTS